MIRTQIGKIDKDIHGTLSDFLRKTEMETAEKCDVMIKYGDVKK